MLTGVQTWAQPVGRFGSMRSGILSSVCRGAFCLMLTGVQTLGNLSGGSARCGRASWRVRAVGGRSDAYRRSDVGATCRAVARCGGHLSGVPWAVL